MTERGILFSKPMVLALLAGRKTQTRRLVKPSVPVNAGMEMVINRGDQNWWAQLWPTDGWMDDPGLGWRRCPYGVPGDRLWVRETFSFDESLDLKSPSDVWEKSSVRYAAGGERVPRGRVVEWGRNRPGIHMPCWASRITLEVVKVRAQRVQDLSIKDAIAEGYPDDPLLGRSNDLGAPGRWFSDLWDQINGERAAWASNPWVWVITFRRLP